MKRRLAFLAGVVIGTLIATAMEPPTAQDIEKYIKDGSYPKREKFVKEVGNHRVRPELARRALRRLQQASGVADSGAMEGPLPNLAGMPTKGTNNILVLLIDFPDYAHENEASLISSKLFGPGVPSEYPKESLVNFYRRSSYNQLEIQGAALGWYRMQHPRNWYTTTFPSENEANGAIIQEVVSAYDGTIDFSRFDNDGDGEVDYFAVIWAGPDNGWGNFWWGYQWSLYTPVVADGVRFRTFSWQWESRPVGTAFQASTIIHETGHALGLPDYYDYDPSHGPAGGVGGLDMMDNTYGDHNAFSKFMLEWLVPVVVPAGSSNLTLHSMASTPEAVAVMPNLAANAPYTEYFLMENRYRTNNDVLNPSDGVLIWHVDATPNDRREDFLFDNSYTEHKLLRLMEADGLEEIENGDGRADSGDFWKTGKVFGPGTTPNSRAYDGSDTGVTMDGLPGNGPSMEVHVAVEGLGAGPRIQRSPDRLTQTALQGYDPEGQTFKVWAAGGVLSYAMSDDAAWLSVTPASGLSSGEQNTCNVSYSVAGLSPGTYNGTIVITAPDATNSPQQVSVTLTVMGNNIGQAVDATNLTWTAGGNSLWFEQTSVTHDGLDSVQSGALGNNQANWIQTSVQGPGQLSFWWKVSSEADYDFLRFYVDDQESVQGISGATEWQRIFIAIPEGQHTLRWSYTKDQAVVSGADAGWVDQVTFVSADVPPIVVCDLKLAQIGGVGQNAPSQFFHVENGGGGAMSYTLTTDAAWLTVSPAAETSYGAPNTHTVVYNTSALPLGTNTAHIIVTAPAASNSPVTVPVTLDVVEAGGSIAEAVDFPLGVWTTGGDGIWQPSLVVTHDGRDAAVSPDLNHNQYAWVETIVQGPGMLSWWWKVSSEANYDYLDFLLDDKLTGVSIDGEVDWRHESLVVPPGPHTVTWVYGKDEGVDGGSDTAWLDQVAFDTTGRLPETLLSTDFSQGLPPGWQNVDNVHSGAVWSFNDPCQAGNLTGGSNTFAIADSDCAGEVWMDTELVTPGMDLSRHTNVVLEFKSDLVTYSTEIADVDIRIGGGQWVNVWKRAGDDFGPKTYRINLPQADLQSNVQVRFHYWNAFYDLFWGIDDVMITGVSAAAPSHDYTADWRQAWDNFDKYYSRFAYKGINWGTVYDAQKDSFVSVTNDTGFAVRLNAVLQTLNDAQIKVKGPDNVWLGSASPGTNNCPAQPFSRYSTGGGYANFKGANAILHSWVAQTIAHVIVTSLEDERWSSISDGDLDALLGTYTGAEGLILDLRASAGGNVTNAIRIASRFTDLPRVYGYTRTRSVGGDASSFGPFIARLLQPSTAMHFTKKVVCLTGQATLDAGEWLALMLKACPQATLMGDRTRGAAGATQAFSQTEIGLEYFVPRDLEYDSDQAPFQDSGIWPAIAMSPGLASYDESQQRDYVLERSIAWLRRPVLTARAIEAGGIALQWPVGPGSTYTLLSSTNLLPGSWVLANGSQSNQPGFQGTMFYTNASAGPRQYYRIEVGP